MHATSIQKKAGWCAQCFAFGMEARAFALKRYMARLAPTQRQQTEQIHWAKCRWQSCPMRHQVITAVGWSSNPRREDHFTIRIPTLWAVWYDAWRWDDSNTHPRWTSRYKKLPARRNGFEDVNIWLMLVNDMAVNFMSSYTVKTAFTPFVHFQVRMAIDQSSILQPRSNSRQVVILSWAEATHTHTHTHAK